MLVTATKPYNPNKKQSLDTDWNKLDLCAFLRNINIINIDQNDISVTGKDYGNATKREIVAEIIRTINATHYNSLLGMKDIINHNNNIIKITEGRNKSISICNKKIKYLEANINRIRVLLTQAAHTLPAGTLIDYQNMEKAQNILKFTCCNDLTFTEDDFKFNNITNNKIQQLSESNINYTNDIIKNIAIPTESNNNAIPSSTKVYQTHDNIATTPPIKSSLVVNTPLNDYDNNIKTQKTLDIDTEKNIQDIMINTTQASSELNNNNTNDTNNNILIPTETNTKIEFDSVIPSCTIGDAINIDNITPTSLPHKQDTHDSILTAHGSHKRNIQCVTDKTVNIEPITHNPSANLREINNNKKKQQSKSKIKLKNAPKKRRNKNNKKKQKKKHFKTKKHKQKKLNTKQKENILTDAQINEMIKNYEFTYDQYQDFMNLRMCHRSGLSPYDYYEETIGPITDEKIKEWSSVYHSN